MPVITRRYSNTFQLRPGQLTLPSSLGSEVWEYRVAWESVALEQVMQNHADSHWPCSEVESRDSVTS